ncbi:MAG: glutaredoxin 3 [Gammaproteobacteria bacterium]|jgi:glutaredoxin 3|tara:strand:+ start:214 stop:468 length:255 start_codon:yes stop_codon:yes gene_type:complete
MKKVVIYSTRICPFCVRAKNFFTKKDIPYEDIMIDQNPEEIKIMMERSKRQSVPQIFIGDYHVGGFDDLIEHDMDGKLENLLKD